jgi:hypothetical protein
MKSRRHSTRADRLGVGAPRAGKELNLLLFLKAILAELGPGETVGERFSQQELRRLADKFELQNSDWLNLFEIVLSKKMKKGKSNNGHSP